MATRLIGWWAKRRLPKRRGGERPRPTLTHLSTYEWKSVPVHNGEGPPKDGSFTRNQVNALLKAARSHPLANRHGTNILIDRHSEIVAQQVVGVLAAPGCSLEILPKIDAAAGEGDETLRARLVSMLDIALGLKLGDGQSLTMARQKHTLLDILIRVFADRLLAETRRGLPRAYLQQEEDLSAMRGRLDVRRQFTRHAVRPDRLACRFDELSPDMALLRIMKACVVALRRHCRTTETQRRLDEIRFVLADVTDLPPNALPWSDVRIDRTSRRWEGLVNMAKLFLRRDWQRTDYDQKSGHGITLLFAMNDLFEAYIAALVRRAVKHKDLDVRTQGGLKHCLIEQGDGGQKRFQTSPDILVTGAGKRVVIDTKWKQIGLDPEDKKHGVSQSDVYQMMAYARLYESNDLMLLYPHHVGLGREPVEHAFGILPDNEMLRIASVDLSLDTSDVVERLSKLLG